MLDVRPTAYVKPIAEQPFAALTPLIHVINAGDETAVVNGLVRIYRGSTGLLLYTSALATTMMVGHTEADISALTPWSPPAPADDDYFIICSTQAENDLVPDGLPSNLPAYTFDIKPVPLGPVPAGHHTTHEAGGSDQVNLAGMTGLLATPQTPIAHALEHEPGGSDPIDVTGMPGILAQRQTPAIHGNEAHNPAMEEQPNKGIAGGYAGLPNPLDPTRPLRADGIAAQPLGFYRALEFTHNNNQLQIGTWLGAAIGAGTTTMIAGEPNHPGVLTLNSAAGANTGYFFRASLFAFLIAGNERADFVFRPQTLAGLISRRGFIDSFGTPDEGDGCYLEINTVGGNPGVIVGKTSTFSARSTTATSYQLITNTWYRGRVLVNTNATQVDFYLFSEAGALRWHDSLTRDIPTTATHETGHGIVSFNTNAAANALTDEDFMDVEINRVFVR